MELSNTFVILMGLGTVFVGLICIILLCELSGFLCNLGTKKEDSAPTKQPDVQLPPVTNHQELVAAVSAAIAEDLDTDIRGIRIVSMKQI